MPPTYSIWNTTTIILVMDGNFNMVQGNLRHLDRSSTTIINTDSNESTVTGQSLLSTTSLAPTFPLHSWKRPILHPAKSGAECTNWWLPGVLPPNPSVERPDHDTDRPPTISETPCQPVDVAVSAQSTMETSSLDDGHSSPLPSHQSSTEASELQLSLSPPRQSKSDERASLALKPRSENTLIKANKFKSVHTKIRDRLKRAFRFFSAQRG